MDIDLLSKMVKDLILDNDEVSLPGVGTFVAELVPSTFSDKGYTINPPYRRLYFRQRKDTSDTALVNLYAKSNNLDYERAKQIIDDFLGEMKDVLKQKKTIIFPGLGRLRATKENNIFFVADEDLDIYPSGFGLGPISLKTHVETSEEVAAAVASLKDLVAPTASTPASEPVEEPVEEPVSEPVAPKETYESPEMNLFTPVANPAVPQPASVTDSAPVDIPEDSAAAAEEEPEETAKADSSVEEEEPIVSEENTEEVLPEDIEPSDDVIPEEEPEEIEDEVSTEGEEPEVSPTEEPSVDILPEIEVFPAPSDPEILPDEEKDEVSDEDGQIIETDSAPEEVPEEESPAEENSPQEKTSPETPSEEESTSPIEEEEVPSSEKEDEKDVIGTPVVEESEEDDSPEEEVTENEKDAEVAPEPVAEEPKEVKPQPVTAVPEVPKPSDSKAMGDKVAALIKEKNPVISTPSVLNEPQKKKGMPVWAKVLLWTLGILLALLILYMIIGRVAPNFIDNLLYSKEDLEFLRDGVL